MPKYRHPGVYIQQVPTRTRHIAVAETSTAVFIGPTPNTTAGTLVQSWQQYETAFGYPGAAEQPALIAVRLAVYAYFLNGGQRAHIIRVGNTAAIADYNSALAELDSMVDANILLLPGQSWDGGTGQAILEQAISHCETTAGRMVIIDLPQQTTMTTPAQINALQLSTSSVAASYYPWPLISNPLPGHSGLVAASPAAFAAGVWSNTDAREGVWKAPAGPKAQLRGVSSLPDSTDTAVLEALNERGINTLRELPRLGPVIWGARTLASQTDPQWRYISVRRCALLVEKSISQGIEWAVFEANDQNLWTALKQACETFLANLYRSGAFQGHSPREAYYLRCGLGETMTQADIDLNLLKLELGIALLKPAEFAPVRISKQLNTRS